MALKVCATQYLKIINQSINLFSWTVLGHLRIRMKVLAIPP